MLTWPRGEKPQNKLLMMYPATATRKATQNVVAIRDAITMPITSRPLHGVTLAAVGVDDVEAGVRSPTESKVLAVMTYSARYK